MVLFLIILMVIVSILMCGIVMIQNSKGGGLASGFASSNQIMGVRKTTDFLEKATWTFACTMVVLSILIAYALPSANVAVGSSVLQEEAEMENTVNPLTAPGFETPAAEPATAAPAENNQQN